MLETGLYRGRASAIPKPHHSRSALAAEAAPEGVVKDGIAETVPRYESRLVGRCWNPISAHQPLPRIQNCTPTHYFAACISRLTRSTSRNTRSRFPPRIL